MADYKEVADRFQTRKGDKNVTERVLIHRTEGFDDLMNSVREGFWRLPGDPGDSLHPDVELLINHMTSLRRDVEERKLQSGVKKVGVWRKLRPDHLAHCMLYTKTAYEITKGKRHRVVIIGSTDPLSNVAVIEDEDDLLLEEEGIEKPHKSVMVEIVGLLAEVPNDQIIDYLMNKDNDQFEIPFPLNVKLKKTLDIYGEDDVYYMLNWLASNPDQVIEKNQYNEKDLTRS
jgi:hypothetical protein